MKRKHLIGGLILSTFMSLGAVVAFNSAKSESKPVEAATTCFTDGSDIFLDPGVWNTGGAAFIAYFVDTSESAKALFFTYDSSGNDWYSATYHVKVPGTSYYKIVFCRVNPTPGAETGSGWDIYVEGSGTFHVWNQTNDVNAGNWDKCSITGWDRSNYSTSNQVYSAFDSWNVSHSVETDGTWSTTESVNLTGFQNNDKGSQLYSTSVTLTAGMQLKVVNATKNWWCGSNTFEDGGACNGVYLQKGSGDANVTVLKSGTYEFYVKLQYKQIWVQLSSSAEAEIYANDFLSTIICNSDSVKFAINAWNTVGAETTSMEYKYGQLTQGARSLLKGASASEGGSKVEQCAARYDRILSKYGYDNDATDKYHDFMGRTPSSSSSGVQIFVIGDSGSSIFLGISVVAVASIAAIGGYLFLRKKKEN